MKKISSNKYPKNINNKHVLETKRLCFLMFSQFLCQSNKLTSFIIWNISAWSQVCSLLS